jgi:molybdenum cofactor cytidylyltransferase
VILAVVPAAGHSTRMGRPKLALPLGGRTVLEVVVAALRDGGAEHVVVVIGPHVPELGPPAEAAVAEVCRLPEPTPDMRVTVEHGLRRLEERYRPRSDDAFLLAPGDHPAFDAGVVRALCAAYLSDPARSIVVPVHAGRRGHPTLIGWRHVAGIRALPPDRGIDAYLRGNAAETQEVPVAAAGVLFDLDTPEDYDRLRRS